MKNSNPVKYFNDNAAARKKSMIKANDNLVKAQKGLNKSDTTKTPSKDLWKDGLMFDTREAPVGIPNIYVRPTGGPDEYKGNKSSRKIIKKFNKRSQSQF
jgi:hypothetical protein